MEYFKIFVIYKVEIYNKHTEKSFLRAASLLGNEELIFFCAFLLIFMPQEHVKYNFGI